MISAARLAANRQNAIHSTGPRTREGRERAARNARRHGLAVPIETDPAFSARIQRYAEVIAAGSSIDAAWPLAQAYVELERIRITKSAILSETNAELCLSDAVGDLDPLLFRSMAFARALPRLKPLLRYERAAYRRLWLEQVAFEGAASAE